MCFSGALELSCVIFADSVLLHTFSIPGGLKWKEKLTSHFLLGHIAYSSEYTSGEPTRDLDVGSATLNMFMDGTKSLCNSKFGHLTGNMLPPSVF